MPPRVCNRRTPSDGARRLAVSALASGCKTLEKLGGDLSKSKRALIGGLAGQGAQELEL